jgi:hypothetical protein
MAHLRLVPTIEQNELLVFTVEWDRNQQKFVALDDSRKPLGASPNQSNAIGRAIRDANIACRKGCRVAVQVLQQNGIFRNEYIVAPPPPRR